MNEELLALTADIVSAHVSNSQTSTADVPALIASTFEALSKLGQPAEAEAAKAEPAVAIRSSIKNDYIVCLEDGKKLKMLKRYLRTNYHMTPEEYRSKWGLPRDYPMVAPAYAATRKALAQKIGLGRKKAVETVEAAKAPVKRAAKSVSEGLDKARQHLGGATANGDAVTKPSAKRGRPAKAKAEASATTDA